MARLIFNLIAYLQMFANVVDTTLRNELSPEMKTFYDMNLIENAGPNLVHNQFGEPHPIPANGGKKIEFRKFETLPKATVPLTEGVTPDGKNLSVTTVTADVNQYGDYIRQTDLLELTAIDNTIVQATKKLGEQAGRTLDTVVRDILHTGTNVLYANKISGSTETEVMHRYDLDETAKMTVDTVERAATKLRANNVKPMGDGYYVAIIHPHVAYDIRRDPEFISAHKYAQPRELYTGEIGEIAGVRFVQTTEAKIYNGNDLASNSRTLSVNGSSVTNTKTVPFDGGTVADSSLVGRYVLINGQRVKVVSNTTSQLTLDTNVTAADNTVIYPGEGGAAGIAVYGSIFLGQNAYATTEITGGGLETIVKQKGYGEDPLNQRSSVGWKATKTAAILLEEGVLRVETASKYKTTPAN